MCVCDENVLNFKAVCSDYKVCQFKMFEMIDLRTLIRIYANNPLSDFVKTLQRAECSRLVGQKIH